MLPDRGILIGRLLLFTLLLAAVFRFYELDRLGLWADELWVVMDSRKGTLWDMLLTVYYQDNHPPGYYLLSRYTQFLFGSSDFAIRLPSALAGILLVAITFVAGRKHFSPVAALIAAVLVAGSYQAIYYSQEARANIFIALFSLLSFHYFRALVLEGDLSRRNFIAFWIFSALNAYFHYVGLVFTISLFFIYLAIFSFSHKKNQLLLGLKIFTPVLLLYAPWLPGTYHDLVASPAESWQYTPTAQTLVSTFVFLFGPGDIRVYGYGLVLAGLPLWIAAVVIIKPWRERYAVRAKVAALLWFCIVLPIVFFYLKSVYSQSAYNRRHFLFFVPFLALLCGMLLAQFIEIFSEKYRSKVLVFLIALIFLYQGLVNSGYALYSGNHFKQDYRESAKLIIDLTKSESLIVSNSRFFDHYLLYFSKDKVSSSLLLNDTLKINEIDNLLTQKEKSMFFYLEAPSNPAANKMVTDMDQSLAKKYQAICRDKFIRTQVILFENRKLLTADTINWESLPRCVTEK